MEIMSPPWFSELGMEDYNFIHQCQVNNHIIGFTPNGIASTLGETLQQSLSSDNHSSYHTFKAKATAATAAASIMTTFTADGERPTKLHKTNSWEFHILTENVASHPSSSSESSQILSFENSNSTPSKSPHLLIYGNKLECEVKPNQGDFQFQTSISKEKPNQLARNHLITRTPSNAQDHIMAERKRREKLSQRFIALSAIIPGLKKMDKASVLGDAIKHLKQLQERIQLFEEQMKNRTVEVVLVKKTHMSDGDESCSYDEDSHKETLPEIEARVSGKNVLIKIHCKKHNGAIVKILSEIENLSLSILNSNVLPFGNTLDITIIAQMEDEFDMTVKDLVKKLRIITLKLCDMMD